MLVSIIIPSYNHSLYIKDCIDSVLNQSYEDIELIIVDDGSSDNSVDIINSFDDERLSLYVQENQGAHNAINKGLSLSHGEVLTILNSDDMFHKDRLKEAINIFQTSSYDFISTWIDVIDSKGRTLGTKKSWRNMLPWEYDSSDETFLESDNYQLNTLMTNFVSTTSNMLFRRTVYENIGGMRNLRFTHDWDFLLRVSSQYSCYELLKPLVYYRIHDNNTISSSRKWMLFEICWIYAANINKFTNNVIFKNDDRKLLASEFSKLFYSMNFQGNDKIVWALMSLFQGLRQQGYSEPEMVVLNDQELLNSIIDKVVF